MTDIHRDRVDGLVKLFDLLLQKETDQLQNNPQAVLDKIDLYSGLMTVGPDKGKVVMDEIVKKNPTVMIELGCFVGYLAIYFAQGLSTDANAKYYSFEVNPYYAKVAQRFIDLAGMQDKIEIIVGKANKTLEPFQESLNKKFGQFTPLDFVFIDHWKDLYVPDLRVLETLNFIAPGTLIVADNILFPGAPEYVQYIQGSPEERRQYNYEVENKNGKRFVGRWNILYESRTEEVVGGGMRDALEITVVTDYLNG